MSCTSNIPYLLIFKGRNGYKGGIIWTWFKKKSEMKFFWTRSRNHFFYFIPFLPQVSPATKRGKQFPSMHGSVTLCKAEEKQVCVGHNFGLVFGRTQKYLGQIHSSTATIQTLKFTFPTVKKDASIKHYL